MARVTGPQVWQPGDTAVAQRHTLPGSVRQAVGAIMAWRTARVGGQVPGCPDGYVSRVWDHACRHRRWPQGAGRQGERWRPRQKARLLAWAHDQGSLTRPEEHRGLGLTNVRLLTQRFCATGRETLEERLGEAHALGAQPGGIVALPPPRHGVVPGGGGRSRGRTACPCGTGPPGATNGAASHGTGTSGSGSRRAQGCAPL